MTPLIRFHQVSKKYYLRRERPRSFREAFVSWQRRFARTAAPESQADEFWALRNVSLEIHPGETVGLIGPNGAGKSTSLKLMTRIIHPTSGRVEVAGRVAALLELGMGFHPELSGRENIFMSGALIGMGRREMQRKFAGIVDFSELEEFIDAPVKHYSSGMFARLAFAVSIHLDPEVLLVDEVLAVGDQAFQQKCMDRIAALQHSGVTICMVTHSLDTIRTMCTRAVWFDHGRVLAEGAAESVARQYLDRTQATEARRLADETAQALQTIQASPTPSQAEPLSPEAPPKRWGTRRIEITRVRLTNARGEDCSVFATGEGVSIELHYHAHTPTPAPIFGLAIHRQDGLHVTGPNTTTSGYTLPDLSGNGVVRYDIAQLALLEGLYHLSVAVVNQTDTETYDYHDRLYPFRVQNSSDTMYERYGLVTLRGQWAMALA